MKKIVNFKSFNESKATNVTIDINTRKEDERSPRKRKSPMYDVTYSFYLDGELAEISGHLEMGLSGNYEFEPSWFSDQEAEKYYDSNWDNIEIEIVNKLHEVFKEI